MKPENYYQTPLLKKRCQEYGIPTPSFFPMDNNVLVWRLPSLDVSRGGLLLPEDARSPHIKGILMAMGPRAMDVLKSNGIEEGHTIVFARFAGWEATDSTSKSSLSSQFIMLKDRDVIGSDELKEEIASGKAKYVLENGRYSLQRKLLGGRKEKLLALAASTDSPAEAATARKLAQGA